MTVLGNSAPRHATGTARRSRTRLVAVFAGLAAALGVFGMPGVAGAVTADFEASAPDLTVQFTDGSTGAGTWSWDFGDGTPFSNEASPKHTYAAPGIYTVKLTVTSSDPFDPQPLHTAQQTLNLSAPTAAFTASASVGSPTYVGVPVTFSDASTRATSYSWDYGDGTPGSTAVDPPSHAYAAPKDYTVTLTVANAYGSDQTTRIVRVANRAPKALLTVTPNPAAIGSGGATVSFDATASGPDPDGDALRYEWDFGDDSPPVVTTTPVTKYLYTATGQYPVTVTVSDGRGASVRSKTTVLQVIPSPLTASFTYAPIAPGVGTAITLTSTSVGPDSPITRWDWDLDNDGQFDDASGPSAQWSFAAAGSYQVSLKVTNAKGVSSVSFQTINVTGPATAQSPASSASTTPQGTPSLRRMNPFPIIRLRGTLRAGVARITLLTVKAPKGAKIRVLCKGRSCPYARKASTARFTTRAVRFRAMERRLRAGTVITVMVTKSSRIGKYTRFTIRSGAAPRRVDRCLAPGSFKPVKCSSLR